MCSLGEIGGLLFLALAAIVIGTAFGALAAGPMLTRWFKDVQRLEAVQGKIPDKK